MASDEATVRHVLGLLDRLSHKTLNCAVLQFRDHTQRFYDTLSELKNLNIPSEEAALDVFAYPPSEPEKDFSKFSNTVQAKCVPLNSNEVQEDNENYESKQHPLQPQGKCTPIKPSVSPAVFQVGVENCDLKRYPKRSHQQRKPNSVTLPQRVTRSRAKQLASSDTVASNNPPKTEFVVLQDFTEAGNKKDRYGQRNRQEASDAVSPFNCKEAYLNQNTGNHGLQSHETVVASENKPSTPASIQVSKTLNKEGPGLRDATPQIGLLSPPQSSQHRSFSKMSRIITPLRSNSKCGLHFCDQSPKLSILKAQSTNTVGPISPKAPMVHSAKRLLTPAKSDRSRLGANGCLFSCTQSNNTGVATMSVMSKSPHIRVPSATSVLPKSPAVALPKCPTSALTIPSTPKFSVQERTMLGKSSGLPLKAQSTSFGVGTSPNTTWLDSVTAMQSRSVTSPSTPGVALPKYAAAALLKSPTVVGQDRPLLGETSCLRWGARSTGSGGGSPLKSPNCTLPEFRGDMLLRSEIPTLQLSPAVALSKSPMAMAEQSWPLLGESTCRPLISQAAVVRVGTLPESQMSAFPESPTVMLSRTATSILPSSRPGVLPKSPTLAGKDRLLLGEINGPPSIAQSTDLGVDNLPESPVATIPESPMAMLSRSVKAVLPKTATATLTDSPISKPLIVSVSSVTTSEQDVNENSAIDIELKLQKSPALAGEDRPLLGEINGLPSIAQSTDLGVETLPESPVATIPESPMAMLSTVKASLPKTATANLTDAPVSKPLIASVPLVTTSEQDVNENATIDSELKLERQSTISTKDRFFAVHPEKSDAFEFHIIPSIQKHSPRLTPEGFNGVNLGQPIAQKRKLSVRGISAKHEHPAKKRLSPSCNSPLYEAFLVDEKPLAMSCQDETIENLLLHDQETDTLFNRLNTPRNKDHGEKNEVCHQSYEMTPQTDFVRSISLTKADENLSEDQGEVVKRSSFAQNMILKDKECVFDNAHKDNVVQGESPMPCTVGVPPACQQSKQCVPPTYEEDFERDDRLKDCSLGCETMLQYEPECVSLSQYPMLEIESHNVHFSPNIGLHIEPENVNSSPTTRLQVEQAKTSLRSSCDRNVSIEKSMDEPHMCLQECVKNQFSSSSENPIQRNNVEHYINKCNGREQPESSVLNVYRCEDTPLGLSPASLELKQNMLVSPFALDNVSMQTYSVTCTSCVSSSSKIDEYPDSQMAGELKEIERCHLELVLEKHCGQVAEHESTGTIKLCHLSPLQAESVGKPPSEKKKNLSIVNCNLGEKVESPCIEIHERELLSISELCQMSPLKSDCPGGQPTKKKNKSSIKTSECALRAVTEQVTNHEGDNGDDTIHKESESLLEVEYTGRLHTEKKNELCIESGDLEVELKSPCNHIKETEWPRILEACQISPLNTESLFRSPSDMNTLSTEISEGIPEGTEQGTNHEGNIGDDTSDGKSESLLHDEPLGRPSSEKNDCRIGLSDGIPEAGKDQETFQASDIGDDMSDSRSEMDCSESPLPCNRGIEDNANEDRLPGNDIPKEWKGEPFCDDGFLKFTELLAQGTVNSSRRKRGRSPALCTEEFHNDLKRMKLSSGKAEQLKNKGLAYTLHAQSRSFERSNSSMNEFHLFSPIRRFQDTFGMTFGESPSKSLDTTDFQSWQKRIMGSGNSFPRPSTMRADYLDTPHIRSVRIGLIDGTSVKSSKQNSERHLVTHLEEDEKENQSPNTSNRDSEASILSDWQVSAGARRMFSDLNGSLGKMENLHKPYNLSVSTGSFLDLVRQKQVPLQHLNGKREVRVKALEAAELARKQEEKREIDRRRKRFECASSKGVDLESITGKVTDKVKRAAESKIKMDLEKAKKQEAERRRKDEERKKNEAKLADKKRQREDAEKRDREEKRKRVEEAQRLRKEQEERQRAELNEKEIKRKFLEERERERKAQEEEAKRQRRLEKEKEAERRRKQDQHLKAIRAAEKQAERKRKEAMLSQTYCNEDDEFLTQIAHGNKLSFLSTESCAVRTSNDLEEQSKSALDTRSQMPEEMWGIMAPTLGTSAFPNNSERLAPLVENESYLSSNTGQMMTGLGAKCELLKNTSCLTPFVLSDAHASVQLDHFENEIQSYEISPYKSSSSDDDDDDDDDKPQKPVPLWARKENLLQQLMWQQPINPDHIFSSAKTCSLSEIFGTTGSRRCRDFTKRSASGDWLNDHTTWKEELDYKKAMGYV